VTTRGTPRQKLDYRLERLGDEILLYHPARTKAIYLNETASLVWALCNGERTTDEIAGLLRDAFHEQAVEIGADVAAILRHFAEQDVVEFV
jgi:hypothetical protein